MTGGFFIWNLVSVEHCGAKSFKYPRGQIQQPRILYPAEAKLRPFQTLKKLKKESQIGTKLQEMLKNFFTEDSYTSWKSDSVQITTIKNEKGDITTDSSDSKE